MAASKQWLKASGVSIQEHATSKRYQQVSGGSKHEVAAKKWWKQARVNDAELVVMSSPLNDATMVGKEEEVKEKLPQVDLAAFTRCTKEKERFAQTILEQTETLPSIINNHSTKL